MIVAETSRLILRHFTLDDVDALSAILGDPDVMRYSLDGTKTRSQTFHFIDNIIYYYQKYNFSLYAIINKDNQELIGFCGLLPWKYDGKKEVEIGYRLAKAYWGNGFATEAAVAICSYARKELKLTKLFCIIEPENKRSIRVAEKLGMKYQKNIIFHSSNVNVYFLNLKVFSN